MLVCVLAQTRTSLFLCFSTLSCYCNPLSINSNLFLEGAYDLGDDESNLHFGYLGKMLSLDFSQDLFSHVFEIVVSGFSVLNGCDYVHV